MHMHNYKYETNTPNYIIKLCKRKSKTDIESEGAACGEVDDDSEHNGS